MFWTKDIVVGYASVNSHFSKSSTSDRNLDSFALGNGAYIRVMMFCCHNVETNNGIETLASEGVTFSTQARYLEYLTARNIFDTELLFITISRTALHMATSYSNFMEQTRNADYSLIRVNREDQRLYRNMLLFIFTGQLLEPTKSKGINPNIEGGP
jgi:hypothetical protein